MKKGLIVLMLAAMCIALAGCNETSVGAARTDTLTTIENADRMQDKQATPTDIDYSLERDNLIRRAYWVNGQREKAISMPCPVDRPLGYIALFTESGAVVGNFIVNGKVTSLNSFLTPDSEYYEYSAGDSAKKNRWLADVDGSYGENDDGIFFFTPDGKYIEWTGIYLYSDIPFTVDNPVIRVEGIGQ